MFAWNIVFFLLDMRRNAFFLLLYLFYTFFYIPVFTRIISIDENLILIYSSSIIQYSGRICFSIPAIGIRYRILLFQLNYGRRKMSDYKILMNCFITPWESANQFVSDFAKTVEYKTQGQVTVDVFGYAYNVKGGTTKAKHSLDDILDADLLIDRSGTMLAFAGHILRTAVLRGVQVMNYPVAFDECKSLDYQIAHEIGVPVPRTILVAPHGVAKFVTKGEEGRPKHEVDFESVAAELGGFPFFFKSAHGGGKAHVYKVESLPHFVNQYLEVGGSKQMVCQEFIDFDHYVRCFALGDKTLKVKYDPDAGEGDRYKKDINHLSYEDARLLEEYIHRINRHMGYVINTLEFARSKKDGVWYAIDFTNGCNFDMRPCELGEELYTAALHTFVDLAIDYVYNPRPIKPMTANFAMANHRLLERVKHKPGINLDKFKHEYYRLLDEIGSVEQHF